ncbi:hypothetical protein CU097_006964 [Rhizopus azygosporus]|uniref:SWIM-type domain-containing protein n=1 Tax=Rhizopus azygosporus TaxID=86630 RepID=A0A367JD34_RHIAZ|nr:hypothetical protein CU097_006964 [Rhizopus azygosporus]
MELYHNLLKTFHMDHSRSVRVDRLIYLLSLLIATKKPLNQKKNTVNVPDYDSACGMVKKIEDNLFQCKSFTHNILYYDIEVRNGYLYSCSCPAYSRLCKNVFLVNRIFQVPFTERSTLHVTPVIDENAALSSTIEGVPNTAFGNTQSTSNKDERNLRFNELINKGKRFALLAQQGQAK